MTAVPRTLLFHVTCCLLFVSLLAGVPARGATVEAYTTPSLGELSSVFTLSVAGSNVPVYTFQRNSSRPDYYFAHFSFDGEVTLTVHASHRIKKATVNPLAFNIPVTSTDDTASFVLRSSRYLIVKIDDEKELVIAADALENQVPKPKGAGIFNVTDFAADNTGKADATKAFTAAIQAATTYKGGGTVYVPDGLYTVSNLILKSNVTLYLRGGAVIQATKDATQYKLTFVKASPGNYGNRPESGTWLVSTAPNSSNITIRGRGDIDGSGSYLADPAHGYVLDDLIVPLGTSHFTMDGIVGWDAGFWAVTPERSNHVSILNYKGMQSLQTYQDDGIDIDEDQDVLVDHTIIISMDDAYSTKTWGEKTDVAKNWPGHPSKVENVLFHDAIAWTKDGAFKIGQGDFQSHSNITIDGGYVYQAHWAIYLQPIYPKSSDAAPVTNVTFKNMDIQTNSQTSNGKPFTWLYIELPYASMKQLSISHINVRTVGAPPTMNLADHGSLQGFALDDVVVAGKRINSVADMNVSGTGGNVWGVSFNGVPVKR